MHLSLPSNKAPYPHHQQSSEDTAMSYPTGTVSSSLVTADSQYNHDPSLFYGNNSSSSSSHYSSTSTSSPSNVNTQMSHHNPSYPTQQQPQPQQQPSYLASMQPNSTVPLISSPLALNYNSQPTATSSSSSSTNGSSNRTTGYSFRSRNRRDSFQNANNNTNNNNNNSMAFSPPSSYNSPGIASGLTFQPNNNSYSNQRYSHLLSPVAGSVTTGLGSNNSRTRCLSSSSVDSNTSTSTFGFSRLTPAMASMSVQQQQQASATTSPYQSYSSSPQAASGFNQHYQSNLGSPMYPYQSQYAQVPYGSFSTAASAVYEASSPTATSDMLYSTGSNHFGHVTSTPSQSYHSPPRASFLKHGSTTSPYSHTPMASSPPYYEQDPTRLLQQLELNSPAASGMGSRPFDHHSSYGHHQAPPNEYGSYNTGDSSEMSGDHSHGLGIVGGMVGDSAESHNDSSSGPTAAGEGTSEEPRMVLGDDGKTQLFPCGQCEKVFTTKSNLKRHLENVNIHNTPYERRRDQKRWQGHEKKHASREETTLRMRRWREANREKNKFNDMRCRVYRIAKDKFGLEDTDEKEAWIQAEIEKRKGMLLLRHSRKAEWKGMNLNNGSGSNVHDGTSGSLTDGTKYPTGSSSSPFFLYGSPQVTGYDSQGQPIYSSSQPEAYKDTSLKDGDRTFIELLKSEHVPRRRRSRQAMNATVTKAQPFNQTVPSNAPESNILGSPEVMNDEHYAPFGLMKGMLSSSSLLGLGQGLSHSNFGSSVSLSQRGPPDQKKRRNRKQRSISEKKSMFRRRVVTGTSSTSLAGAGSSGLYDSTYLETDQRLQDLYQGVYQTRSLSQALLLNKDQERAQTSSDAMETIVSDLEIGHPRQSSTSSSSTAGSLYADRTELSGWIDWQNPQSASANSNASANASRQYPFPEMTFVPTHPLRDRKSLAKAAGIKIDIPSHQNQLGMNSDWIMMEVATGDDMVGGSATSVASSTNSQLKSPLSAASSMQSPMLEFGANDSAKGLSPEIHSSNGASSTKARVVHKAASHEMFSGLPSTASGAQYPYQSFYGASLTVSGQSQQPTLAQQAQVRSLALARSQGLAPNSTAAEIDYFTTLVLPGAGDISVSSAGSATSAGNGNVPNYLAKQQVNLRRHSTQLSNLSTCLPAVTMGMSMGGSPTGLSRSNSSSHNGQSCGPNDNNPSSLLPEIASLIAESDQERAREHAKKQQITVPMGPGTMAATFYPFPTTTAAPNNNTFSGIYTPFTFGDTQANTLPSIPDRVLGGDRSKLITPAHPHTMGDIMLTVGGGGEGMDVIGINNARKNPLENDDDDAMNEDGDEYQMNAPSGQTHNIGGTPTTMNAAPGALQSSTSELMHDLMSHMQMMPEDSNMFGVEGDSSLAPSGLATSSSFKGTHRITRSGSSFASISRMSIDGVSANVAPGGSDMERSGSSGWWPGGGAQMSSTPTTSTTAATVMATSQSKTTLSSSLSTLSTASTSSSGTGSGAPAAEFAGRTASVSSKRSISGSTGATLEPAPTSSKGEKSKGSGKDALSHNTVTESAKKPPLSTTSGFSKNKKNGSSGSSIGSLFSSSFSNMTASLTSKKKRYSSSGLSQQLADSSERAKGESEKKSNKGEKHSLSPSPSSTAFRPGHPRRSSSILDEFAEVMLKVATKKP
ncbi:hypothetical protein MVEG_06659 [Podila verticillata NRRL 6337]|nr:hypothetical protein MVEG_06659 [Podila verticillata NRRL 6337]